VELGDPRWFLDGLDVASGRANFVLTDRATLSAAPFLDHRLSRPDAPRAAVPLSELRAIGFEPPPLGFIWHTSFCASTLLAACLDSADRCLALKEPGALVVLAALKRGGRLRDPVLARAVFTLLARRFHPREQVLIKPSNSANTLIAEAAALTTGPMLLLYSDCESFLLAMARRGFGGFSYVRDLFMALAADGHPAGRWPADQLLKLTDLQLAALVWRMQMDGLEAASATLGGRARSLDCRDFLGDPGPALRAVDDFLGLRLGREAIERTAAGPLFTHDAKRPGESYDAAARAEEDQRLRARLGPDIDAVLASMAQAFPMPPRLAPALEIRRQTERPAWSRSA
jgi:hypothetical protein